MFLASIIFFFFSLPLVIAALNDATSMKIPNWISVVMIAGFFILIPFTWQGPIDFAIHIAVALTFLLVGFALFSFGLLGGGDAKLMAAAAIWFTWPDVPLFILYTSLFGAALGVILLIGRRYVPVSLLTSKWMHAMFKEESKMPYGLAIAAGGMCVIPGSVISQAALGV